MELLLREIRADEVEQEITQRDQFNTDAVGLPEALVREALQNSMDARSHRVPPEPIRVRISIFCSPPANAAYWRELFDPLVPHLNACEIDLQDVDLAAPRLLVLEDFGTTGLLGATTTKDDRNFSDFWRRTGRSHKHGQQSGRWGLGKLVFSSSSRIHTFFGLTIQETNPHRTPLLMGQAVLKNHFLKGPPRREYAPHAFFAREQADRLQVPETDSHHIARFCEAAGVARTSEPGLSIVVPFVRGEITTDDMLPHIIRNWFFPILTGQLIVQIGQHTIDRSTFAELAREHGGEDFADGKRVEFIRSLHAARASAPSVILNENWVADGIEHSIDEGALKQLRDAYQDGRLISIRAPLSIRPKTGSFSETYVDLYLQQTPGVPRGEAFFIRGAITIPGEARRFRKRDCFAALIAEEKTVVAFLGDAEGPAHTSWSGTAEKLSNNWKNPRGRLKEVRDSLSAFYEAIVVGYDRIDEDALISVFNVPKLGTTKVSRRGPVITKPQVPPIPRSQPWFRIQQRKGGFIVHGESAAEPPFEIRLLTAYDVVEGNPLKLHSPFDFDLTSNYDIYINSTGADVKAISPKELRIAVKESDFAVLLTGFDENRDLFIQADRQP